MPGLVLRTGTIAVLCAFAGCDLGPDYKRPAVEVPSQFRAAADTRAVWPDPRWWHGFRSAELDSLEASAEQSSPDVAAAIARVIQADAQVRQAGAPLLPSVTATAGYTYEHAGYTTNFSASSLGLGSLGSGSLAAGSAPTGSSQSAALAALAGANGRYFDYRTFQAQLGVSYELDFWGKNRAALESAKASAVFSRFDRETTALTVVSSVASTWFNALGYADRLAIAKSNVADAEQNLRVIEGRLAVGTANALDVAQQQTQVQVQRATVPNLESQMEQQIIAESILVGRPPEAITARPGSLTKLDVPEVAPGLPSELLLRRPDVAAAEAQLVAANANMKVARAAFFPQIPLTAAGGVQAGALNALFGPGTYFAQLAASLTQPVFDGGTLRGQLEQAKGRYAELLANYKKAILQAFTDVDTALTAYRYATKQEKLQSQAVATAQRAADIARAQLLAGTVDITALLQAETTLYSERDVLSQVRLARLQALLNLYKALGGGWQVPSGPIPEQFPGLHPGRIPGGVALPVGGNVE